MLNIIKYFKNKKSLHQEILRLTTELTIMERENDNLMIENKTYRSLVSKYRKKLTKKNKEIKKLKYIVGDIKIQ